MAATDEKYFRRSQEAISGRYRGLVDASMLEEFCRLASNDFRGAQFRSKSETASKTLRKFSSDRKNKHVELRSWKDRLEAIDAWYEKRVYGKTLSKKQQNTLRVAEKLMNMSARKMRSAENATYANKFSRKLRQKVGQEQYNQKYKSPGIIGKGIEFICDQAIDAHLANKELIEQAWYVTKQIGDGIKYGTPFVGTYLHNQSILEAYAQKQEQTPNLNAPQSVTLGKKVKLTVEGKSLEEKLIEEKKESTIAEKPVQHEKKSRKPRLHNILFQKKRIRTLTKAGLGPTVAALAVMTLTSSSSSSNNARASSYEREPVPLVEVIETDSPADASPQRNTRSAADRVYIPTASTQLFDQKDNRQIKIDLQKPLSEQTSTINFEEVVRMND